MLGELCGSEFAAKAETGQTGQQETSRDAGVWQRLKEIEKGTGKGKGKEDRRRKINKKENNEMRKKVRIMRRGRKVREPLCISRSRQVPRAVIPLSCPGSHISTCVPACSLPHRSAGCPAHPRAKPGSCQRGWMAKPWPGSLCSHRAAGRGWQVSEAQSLLQQMAEA